MKYDILMIFTNIFNKNQEVAHYIKKKGRVSRADLLIECNKIIKLNPSDKVRYSIHYLILSYLI